MPRGRALSSRYVEREIINHSMLAHPHIIEFKQARAPPSRASLRCMLPSRPWASRMDCTNMTPDVCPGLAYHAYAGMVCTRCC